MLDALIVGFDGLGETVGAIFVCEVGDSGDRPVSFHLGRDLGGVYNYLSVKNLLLDAFIKVIGYSPYKYPLREVASLGRRY